MATQNYPDMLRELSHNYYNRHITTEEYRLRRKNILNALDVRHNGAVVPDTIAATTDQNVSVREQPVNYSAHEDMTVDIRS